MSGLEQCVADAYKRAEETLDPADWALFHALSAALEAERAKHHEPASVEGIPEPPVKTVRISREQPQIWWLGG
jgi:hypothetical protein